MEQQLDVIVKEIHGIEAGCVAGVIEIGKLLGEAREAMRDAKANRNPHWEKWLHENFKYTPRTALRYSKLYQLSKVIDLTGLQLSVSALHHMVELHASKQQSDRDALSKIIEEAKTGFVSGEMARDMSTVIGLAAKVVEAEAAEPEAPSAERVAEKRERRVELAARRILGEKDAWVEAAGRMLSGELRALIDRLEAIYAERTKPPAEPSWPCEIEVEPGKWVTYEPEAAPANDDVMWERREPAVA